MGQRMAEVSKQDDTSAPCLDPPRELPGDFGEIAAKINVVRAELKLIDARLAGFRANIRAERT